ncbi:hypothetical protein BDR06DRAFT_951403 [Suillus hirtellus]|nr:hypothetical protein BDR06DRAFT_951403 [Suillus hirtellus]
MCSAACTGSNHALLLAAPTNVYAFHDVPKERLIKRESGMINRVAVIRVNDDSKIQMTLILSRRVPMAVGTLMLHITERRPASL